MKILLVVYDNDAFIHYFPIGTAYIAAALQKAGFYVEIYNQDHHHYPEEHLTEYLDKNDFDIVGMGVIAGYYQYIKLLKISEAINNAKKKPFYVLGGHGPSPEPEYFLKKTQADAVVIGEGEETIVELVQAISEKKSFSGIKGIAYREGEQVTINERRDLIQDIDSIPYPAYELFPMDYYRLLRQSGAVSGEFVMPLLSGRGCTFKCTFCYRMDKGFRPRSNESIIAEMKFLIKEYQISYFDFSADELLMTSEERVISLCEDFIKVNLKVKWQCNGRLNYAKDDVLKLMKKAGCIFINYGVEAMDNEVLKNMKKGLTVDLIEEGIKKTVGIGIQPGINILFGNIGDNKETLKRGVEFLVKYDDGGYMRTIRPVTPYPGSPLYYDAIEKGLLKDCEDFYENKHLNSDLLAVNFTELTDDEFYQCLYESNVTLLESYYHQQSMNAVKQAKKLYLERDASFRGYRQT